MTEAEVIELTAICASNVFTALTIYISSTFGFLVMSHLIGSKLTTFQAAMVSGLYVIAAGAMSLAMNAWLQALFTVLHSQPTVLDTISLLVTDIWVPGMSIVFTLGIFLSLYFMWNVRHSKVASTG
jgi:hypothetical protein